MENKNINYIFIKTRTETPKYFEKNVKNNRIHKRNKGKKQKEAEETEPKGDKLQKLPTKI